MRGEVKNEEERRKEMRGKDEKERGETKGTRTKGKGEERRRLKV